MVCIFRTSHSVQRQSRLLVSSLLLLFSGGIANAQRIDDEANAIDGKHLRFQTDAFECQASRAYDGELELLDVIVLATCASAAIQRGRAGVDERHAVRDGVAAKYWPTVSAELNETTFKKSAEYNSVPFADYSYRGRSSGASLMLNWILFDAGLRRAEWQYATHMLLAANFDRDDIIRNTLINAVDVFHQAQFAAAALVDAVDAERTAATSASSVAVLLTEGLGSVSDVFMAQTSLDKITMERIRAESAKRETLTALAAVLGLPRSSKIIISNKIFQSPSFQFTVNINTLVSTVLHEHPRLNALQAELDAAVARVEAASSEGLPSLSLTASNDKSRSSQNPFSAAQRTHGWALGLQLTIPLFDGFSRNRKIAAARAQHKAKQAELAVAMQEVEGEIWRVYELLRRQTESVAVAERLVGNALKAFSAAKSRYESGVGSILELLKSQGDLVDSRQQALITRFEWYRSKMEMAILVGDLERFEHHSK